MDGKPHVSVNQIGEYIQRDSCLRRFKLGLNDLEIAKQLPFFSTVRGSLDPVLQISGLQHEDAWAEMLRENGLTQVMPGEGMEHMAWQELAHHLQDVPKRKDVFAREVEITGEIGAFFLHGRMDFVVLRWSSNGPVLRIIECKASRKDRTYHRIQLAAYSHMVRTTLSTHPLMVQGEALGADKIEEVVARLEEEGGVQDPLVLQSINLMTERSDLEHLLAEGGLLYNAYASTELDLLSFQLSSKCDTCVLCPHCLPESARQRKLELLGLDVATVNALRSGGVEDIDELADLDPHSAKGATLRNALGLGGGLESLVARAKARRCTLPEAPMGEYPIAPLPYSGRGQLPPYVIGNRRLIRIYLSVERDYLEDRIIALAAHVTDSSGRSRTAFRKTPEGKWRPEPRIDEEMDGRSRPLQGKDVVVMRTGPWSKDQMQDDLEERELLSKFFQELVGSIADVAHSSAAPVHFYVWSRQEMVELIDACERVQEGLLHHLIELLGCRQPTEQLIFSSLQEEVFSRYATGWTSRSLTSATSLRWFGRSYHWVREIDGSEVHLDRVFEQDIFDFKTSLYQRQDGSWGRKDEEGCRKHTFEIRTRHRDEIRSPYWHSLWGDLPDIKGRAEPNLRYAMRRYRDAAIPLLFETFLRERCHAMRWVEEQVQYKNEQIEKPLLDISTLERFELGKDSLRQAAIDFLRLDHHEARNEWMTSVLRPPSDRVAAGQCIPLRNVEHMGEGLLRAELDLEGFGVDRSIFSGSIDLGEESYVRLTPCTADPKTPQPIGDFLKGAMTAIVRRLDFDKGLVELTCVPIPKADRYRLLSLVPNEEGIILANATLDPSSSDFVASNVDERLSTVAHHHCYRWFDPLDPQVPERGHAYRPMLQALLGDIDLDGHCLNKEQVKACLDGLNTTVQLLLGPPGTGKTVTTAMAIVVRLIAIDRERPLFLVGANTHTAADELMSDLEALHGPLEAAAKRNGIVLRPYRSVRLENGPRDSCLSIITEAMENGAAIVVGTTNQLLKLARQWERTNKTGMAAEALVIDEASMMVLPHFLALTTLLGERAEIMLSGDHLQLSPIVSHDWQAEMRPQSRRYEPFRSCYDLVWDLSSHGEMTSGQMIRSSLQMTYRLGPKARELISPIYRAEGVELRGRENDGPDGPSSEGLGALWSGPGLYLVVHDESGSKKSNPFEVDLIREIVSAGPQMPGSVAIITPHRAQRLMLRRVQDEFGEVISMVDTVERLQGGECDTVIVSGTQSDPNAIAGSADFILDLNRSNVIFSRARSRLIVVCSRNLLNSVPAELEIYQSAFLWKRVRQLCNNKMHEWKVDEHTVEVLKA